MGSRPAGYHLTSLLLRVESVAWATERCDVLSGLFYLLSVVVYVRRGLDTSVEPAVRRRRYWGCLLLFVAALLSKAMAVTLPAVLLLLDVYPLRRFPLIMTGLRSSKARAALLEKLPFFVLSAAASVGPFKAAIAEDAVTWQTTLGWVERAAVSVYWLGFYLWKSICPLGLASLYAYRIPFDPFTRPILLSAAAMAALAILSAASWAASLRGSRGSPRPCLTCEPPCGSGRKTREDTIISLPRSSGSGGFPKPRSTTRGPCARAPSTRTSTITWVSR